MTESATELQVRLESKSPDFEIPTTGVVDSIIQNTLWRVMNGYIVLQFYLKRKTDHLCYTFRTHATQDANTRQVVLEGKGGGYIGDVFTQAHHNDPELFAKAIENYWYVVDTYDRQEDVDRAKETYS